LTITNVVRVLGLSLGGRLDSRRVLYLRRQLEPRGVAPQLLEAVEAALVRLEHVHDEIAVVEEDPLELGLTLAADRLRTGLAEFAFDLIGDGMHLPVGGAGGDQEVVGDDEQFPDAQGHDVRRLLLGGGLRADADEVLDIAAIDLLGHAVSFVVDCVSPRQAIGSPRRG
jgi:hypothetical protein